jgi:tripartite-type tricarboxylate transporter receptor subunit TctC
VIRAAGYPAKPIRMIVPSAPGGGPDIHGRLIAAELTRQMRQQVVVDNRPGASAIIGLEAIAKAPADGYTLGYATFPLITNPGFYSRLPYDTARDFHAVILQSSGAYLMSVTPGLQVKSVRELVDHARAQPGKLSYGGTNASAGNTLAVELLKFMTGTQIAQILYKGVQQAITDTIAGQIHVVCDTPISVMPHVRAGRLRVLGTTSLKRLSIMPDVPTIAEAGLPGYEVVSSNGYIVPAPTPRTIVVQLNAEINKALALPAVSEKFLAGGSLVGGGTPEEFADYLRRETAKWAKVIKAAGIEPQ